jgi:ribosomal protein S18 acetylase RimI-like enzyme
MANLMVKASRCRQCPGTSGGLLRWVFAHAADVAVHGKAQGVGVDAAVIRAVEARLEHHAGVRRQELHHEAVGDQAFVVQVVHQV